MELSRRKILKRRRGKIFKYINLFFRQRDLQKRRKEEEKN